MTASIGYSLGIGSGIDTQALIKGLADAARAPREALITQREEKNAAQISALAEASSSIDSFASALSSLISGGTLFSQPSVSDSSVLTAAARPGARLGDLAAEIEVRQLARSQTLESVALAGASTPVGQGDLTLTTSRGPFTITIDASNDSLDGLARAINEKNTGVTATIVTQAGSARLVLKGATGAAEAFTLSVPAGTTSGLERFTFNGTTGGMTAAQTAQDAIVKLDGVEVRRSSNVISDLIDGVDINLKRAVPGSTISIGITRPTEAIGQAVHDFVAAFNELHAQLAGYTAAAGANSEGGPLRGDLGIRELQRQLANLTSTVLSSQGEGPKTLAEIGVATNRDGTLRINSARLEEVLESDPQGVEALFNPGQYSSSPFVEITSKMGKVKPGTYQLTDLVAAAGGTGASGKINGVAMLSSGASLIAPVGSAGIGLVVKLTGAATSATITVDAGLGGALQAIRDALRAGSGPLATSQDRLEGEAEQFAEDRESLEIRSEAYYDQLVQSFTAMERQVSAFKATQSYLEQQIKIWNGSND